MNLYSMITSNLSCDLKDASDKEVYTALVKTIHSLSDGMKICDSKKKLYYISAEFLIGKLLSNNLINLGIYDEVKNILKENGKDINKIEETEAEPSLGNGGLGRLAACFLDSTATLGLNAAGIGLNYHFGLFKQLFVNNKQNEVPNPWMKDSGFLRKTEVSYKTDLGGEIVSSRMYDLDVIGYNSHVNKLHLFDIETVNEAIVDSGVNFDKTDIKSNLTLFLYPDDSDENGRLLRLYQQYFMVSNAAQMIIDECVEKGSNLYDLSSFAVVQINDTHPMLIIPELIRILCNNGICIEDAINIVRDTCAYTNHTILAEALEKWPMSFLEKVSPQIISIIKKLDSIVRNTYSDKSLYIIDDQNRVHMAHMGIHFGFSINGVARLHTEILKQTELNNFYKIYPDKFNNKTNGITFRRWLLSSNPKLSDFITFLIGDGYKKDAEELVKLRDFTNDEEVLCKLLEIKEFNKIKLKEYLSAKQGISLNTDSIFDMQIKRLHEYKRQQMNALFLITKYFEIKEGKLPERPITAFFGAKAAPAYTIAKDIIHLILCLEELFKRDLEIKQHLNIVMVENYNVTAAEKLIPACDISEQISLASKEASGTGNMKFILNGGIIIGTEDGANVEICEKVGRENIYIFGDDSQTVINRYQRGDYKPREYYENNHIIKKAVDFICSDELISIGDKESLLRLKNELLNKDWFMTFPDFLSYKAIKEKVFEDYENRLEWAKKMLINISSSGYFSSDRTIKEYNQDIWKLNEMG